MEMLETINGLARKHGVQRRMMRQAPRKQRHTAHRIWTRLRPGYSAHAVGEPTVRGYDRVSMPRSYGLGQEAQVDWCEAQAELDGRARKRRIFAIHRADTNATQQAFLEAHEMAFAYFGGVMPQLALRQLEGGGEEDAARLRARAGVWWCVRCGGGSLDFLQGGGDAGQGEVEGLAGGAEVHAHTAGAGAAVVGAGVELDFGVLDEPVL